MRSLWRHTAVLGIYTLSPTHFGTGQTTGAVDLPIARNATNGFPVLPATGIKGVLRDCAEAARLDDAGGETVKRLSDHVKELFGPEIGQNDGDDGLSAGRLSFTEARLLAYPARALSRPFFHVTCPMILDGLARDLRATGGDAALDLALSSADRTLNQALVADDALHQKPIVLEGLIYRESEVRHDRDVKVLAETLSRLIPGTEAPTRQRLEEGLVVLPDEDFGALVHSFVPVRARVKLTGGKTTTEWRNPDSGHLEKDGNLWHEEYLPSDCLFAALIGERRDRAGASNGRQERAGLATLADARQSFGVVQIGGNETVGQGVSLCTMLTSPPIEGANRT